MVFDNTTKVLYIFAGQREDKYLSDMYAYDVKTGIASEISSNFSIGGGPEACFTPRAVIDPSLKEIYVISGLTKAIPMLSPSHPSKAVLKERMHNWVYKYNSRPGKWTQIVKIPDQPTSQRPMPRFAHQVGYNPKTKAIYMHGGNAGESNTENEEVRDGVGSKGRLDDFWKMELKRYGFCWSWSHYFLTSLFSDQNRMKSSGSASSQFVNNSMPPRFLYHDFPLMVHRFRELCETASPVKSLAFLQTEVASVVDHNNSMEEEKFRSLLTHLLLLPSHQQHQNGPLLSSTPHASSSQESSSNSGLELEHEDTREVSTRPRKRSRSERDSEEKSSSSSGEENGVWTNFFSVGATGSFSDLGSVSSDQDMPNPMKSLGTQQTEEEKVSMYRQRTELFEGLLKFVDDGEKQPNDDLLHLVDKSLKGSRLP